MLDAGNSATIMDKRFSSASLVKLCLITNNTSNTITEPKVTFAPLYKGSWSKSVFSFGPEVFSSGCCELPHYEILGKLENSPALSDS